MNIQEYNIKSAKDYLNCDTCYRYYREAYNLFVDIRTVDKKDIEIFYSEKEINDINKMFANFERLKTIANGEALDPLYCLYYKRLYSTN